MDSGLQNTLLIVAGVAGLAWLMRMFTAPRDESASPARGEDDDDLGSADEALEDEGSGPEEIVAISSDGWAFVPRGRQVELIPPGESEDMPLEGIDTAPVNPKTGQRVTGWKPGEQLVRGDLIAARVQRGAPDHDPWRLEALGRDRDYRAWRFETESAAVAALALIEGRIVRPPVDEDGEPMPVGAEDFMVARREAEATEAELAMEPEDEET